MWVSIRRNRQQPRDDALRRHARLGRFASLQRYNILCRKSFCLADAERPGSAFPRKEAVKKLVFEHSPKSDMLGRFRQVEALSHRTSVSDDESAGCWLAAHG